MSFDKQLAGWSLFVDGTADVLVAITPSASEIGFIAFSSLSSFTSGGNPAMHSLGAVCMHAAGRSSEVGSLFGAMAFLSAVAHVISVGYFCIWFPLIHVYLSQLLLPPHTLQHQAIFRKLSSGLPQLSCCLPCYSSLWCEQRAHTMCYPRMIRETWKKLTGHFRQIPGLKLDHEASFHSDPSVLCIWSKHHMYFEQGNTHCRITDITGARHLMAGVYISTASSPVIENTSHESLQAT
jgi:hypothetical protein